MLADLYRKSVQSYRKKAAERLYIARQPSAQEQFRFLVATAPWVLELARVEDVANYLEVEV